MIKLSPKLGFTLLEIVIAVGIFISASLILGNYITRSYKTINFINEFNEAVEEAKKGIKTMNQELREADNAETGAYAINSASAQEIIFYSDIDIDDSTERVRYFLEGTNLKKGVKDYPYTGEEQQTTISQNVQNDTTAIFTYYNESNSLLYDPIPLNQIRLIHTYLEINITPERAPNDYTIETNVHLRNLKQNY